MPANPSSTAIKSRNLNLAIYASSIFIITLLFFRGRDRFHGPALGNHAVPEHPCSLLFGILGSDERKYQAAANSRLRVRAIPIYRILAIRLVHVIVAFRTSIVN